jgi:cytochrome c-type biogenesis protein CcmH/NrfF
MNGLNLRDIKPIVEVSDSSLYILLALIVAVLLVVGGLSFVLYKKREKRLRRYKKSKEFKAKEALKRVDFGNSKEAVYSFSKYAQILAKDEQKSTLEAILKELERYKYKKESIKLSDQDIAKMKEFIKEVI